MKNKRRLTISRTKRVPDFQRCARFMAETEPWLTLRRDYKVCLNSVLDPLHEVYAARIDGAALGFIVLQMTGTFKGYIKTVCVA